MSSSPDVTPSAGTRLKYGIVGAAVGGIGAGACAFLLDLGDRITFYKPQEQVTVLIAVLAGFGALVFGFTAAFGDKIQKNTHT